MSVDKVMRRGRSVNLLSRGLLFRGIYNLKYVTHFYTPWSTTAFGPAVADIKDKAMLQSLTDIERFDQEDKQTIVHVIDSLLRDAKAKKAYGPYV
jgi:hypothetical protein